MKLRTTLISLLTVASCLGATLTAQAATLQAGTLIKGSGSAVYYYAQDGKRYVFPTFSTYATWYDDFSGVVTIPDDQLGSITIGGNVTFKPGVRLVKITTDPKVYAVDAHGTLRWITTESIAANLYGPQWNTQVSDVPDAFFTNYQTGAAIQSASDYNVRQEQVDSATIGQDKKVESALVLTNSSTTIITLPVEKNVDVVLGDPGDGGFTFDESSIVHTGFRLVQTYHVDPQTFDPMAHMGDFGRQVWVFEPEGASVIGTTGQITITASQNAFLPPEKAKDAIKSTMFDSQFKFTTLYPY